MTNGTRVRYVRHAAPGGPGAYVSRADTGTVAVGVTREGRNFRETRWDRYGDVDEIVKTDYGWELDPGVFHSSREWSTVEPLDLPVVQRDLMAQIFSWREGAREIGRRAYACAKLLTRGVW